MYSIGEFSKITNLSIKTIRYYCDLGVLEPASVDEQSGYRYFDDENVGQAQRIVLFRNLGFELKQIPELTIEQMNNRVNILNQNASQIQNAVYSLKAKNLEENNMKNVVKQYDDMTGILVGEDNLEKNLQGVWTLDGVTNGYGCEVKKTDEFYKYDIYISKDGRNEHYIDEDGESVVVQIGTCNNKSYASIGLAGLGDYSIELVDGKMVLYTEANIEEDVKFYVYSKKSDKSFSAEELDTQMKAKRIKSATDAHQTFDKSICGEWNFLFGVSEVFNSGIFKQNNMNETVSDVYSLLKFPLASPNMFNLLKYLLIREDGSVRTLKDDFIELTRGGEVETKIPANKFDAKIVGDKLVCELDGMICNIGHTINEDNEELLVLRTSDSMYVYLKGDSKITENHALLLNKKRYSLNEEEITSLSMMKRKEESKFYVENSPIEVSFGKSKMLTNRFIVYNRKARDNKEFSFFKNYFNVQIIINKYSADIMKYQYEQITNLNTNKDWFEALDYNCSLSVKTKEIKTNKLHAYNKNESEKLSELTGKIISEILSVMK